MTNKGILSVFLYICISYTDLLYLVALHGTELMNDSLLIESGD